MNTVIPKVGATVRAISSIGNGLPRLVYATVLSISPILDENLGENGEPTLSIAYMDKPDVRKLGQVDWHSQLQRHAGVRHVSHEDFADRKVSIGWLDILPDAGESLEDCGLGFLDTQEFMPVTEAPVLTASEKLPAPPNNIEETRGPVNKVAKIQGFPTEFAVDSAVHVEGKLVVLADLKPGMYMEDLKLFVLYSEWHHGTLYISTSETQPPTDDPKPDDAQMPDGAEPADTGYVTDYDWNYGRNNQLIYVKDGAYYINGFKFTDQQKAEAYADAANSVPPPSTPQLIGGVAPVGQPDQQSGENGQVTGAPAGIAPGDAAHHPSLGDASGELEAAGRPEAERIAEESDPNQSAEEQERIRQQIEGGTQTDAVKKGDDAPVE